MKNKQPGENRLRKPQRRNLAKLLLITQLIIASCLGVTLVKFDLKSEPLPGRLYSARDKESRIIVEDNFAEHLQSQANLVVAYIPPKDVGFLHKSQDVEVYIKETANTSLSTKGKIIAITPSALLPDENYDFFRYVALVELGREDIEESARSVRVKYFYAENVSLPGLLKAKVLLAVDRFNRSFS